MLKNTINHFWKKKQKKKSMEQLKIFTQEPKNLENLKITDIKSVTIEHPKTSHKLSKTIRQTKKVSQVGTGKNRNSWKLNSFKFETTMVLEFKKEELLMKQNIAPFIST